MSKEIEIKFRVDDVRALARRLRVAGFRQVTRRTHESNTLYDLPGLKLENAANCCASANTVPVGC